MATLTIVVSRIDMIAPSTTTLETIHSARSIPVPRAAGATPPGAGVSVAVTAHSR